MPPAGRPGREDAGDGDREVVPRDLASGHERDVARRVGRRAVDHVAAGWRAGGAGGQRDRHVLAAERGLERDLQVRNRHLAVGRETPGACGVEVHRGHRGQRQVREPGLYLKVTAEGIEQETHAERVGHGIWQLPAGHVDRGLAGESQPLLSYLQGRHRVVGNADVLDPREEPLAEGHVEGPVKARVPVGKPLVEQHGHRRDSVVEGVVV